MTLTVTSNDLGNTGTGGAQATKPVGNLRWRTAGAAPGTALTTSNVSIASSANGTGGAATIVSYDIVWAYATDTPGTYTIPVVFTAAAP